MSTEALRWVFPLPICGAKKAVLLALAEHADPSGKCWPSTGRLALFAGVTPRAVRREIGSLQADGLLTADRSGGRATSRYQLRLVSTVVQSPEPKRTPEHNKNSEHFNPDRESGFNPDSESASAPGPRTESPLPRTESPPNPQEPPSKKKESDRSRSERERSPPLRIDARSLLWSSGLQELRFLTGQSDRQARALLGKLLRDAKDDCGAVSRALAEAIDLRPIDPVPWLSRAVTAERKVPAQWLHDLLDPAVCDPNTIDGEVCGS